MKNLLTLSLLCSVLLTVESKAAENPDVGSANSTSSIQFDGKRKTFLIRTDNTSYAFGLGANGLFINLHWGGRVETIDDIPEPLETHYFHQSSSARRARFSRAEYPANAEGFHLEPCLKIETPGKLVHLTLVFASHEIRGDHLQVVLKAKDYPLRVILHYQVYPEFDLIDRWVEVKNEGPEEIVVENIQSAVWYVPHTHKYRLTHIAGNWCAEWQVRQEFLEQGEKVLQSRGGISGHFHVPLFALDQDGRATEKSGAVWFGALQWSGNWKMIVEQNPYNQVRVSGGYNDYDFALELAPGKSHSTPVFTAGYTTEGIGNGNSCWPIQAYGNDTHELVNPMRFRDGIEVVRVGDETYRITGGVDRRAELGDIAVFTCSNNPQGHDDALHPGAYHRRPGSDGLFPANLSRALGGPGSSII